MKACPFLSFSVKTVSLVLHFTFLIFYVTIHAIQSEFVLSRRRERYSSVNVYQPVIRQGGNAISDGFDQGNSYRIRWEILFFKGVSHDQS